QRGVVEGRHPAEADRDVLDLEEAGHGPGHRRPPAWTRRTGVGVATPAGAEPSPEPETRSISAAFAGARRFARRASRCFTLCCVSVTIPSGVTISWTMSSAPVTRLNHC